jgi:hypothetical protein
MIANYKDFAVATVSTGYDAAATSIALTAGHGANLPAAPFSAIWWDSTTYASPDLDPNREIIYVGARASDALSVITRGFGSDAASTKNTAGKTYKLMATVTAKEMDNRSRMLGLVGPSGNYITGGTSIEYDTTEKITIPANFVKVGDVLEWTIYWQHTAGAYAATPRTGMRLTGGGNGNYVHGLAASWSTTELTFGASGKIIIRSSNAAAIFGMGVRENGTPSVQDQSVFTVDLTQAMDFQPSLRFDASGETVILSHLSVILHRG